MKFDRELVLKYLNGDFGKDISMKEINYIKDYRENKQFFYCKKYFLLILKYFKKNKLKQVTIPKLKVTFAKYGIEERIIDETITVYQDYWMLSNDKSLLMLRHDNDKHLL